MYSAELLPWIILAASLVWSLLIVLSLRSPRAKHWYAPYLLLMLAMGPLIIEHDVLSDDALRYRWDGWVGMHGRSPYDHPPNAPAFSDLRAEVNGIVYPDSVPYNHILTIYPPGAQHLFGVTAQIAGLSEGGWKLVWLLLIAICIFTAWRWLDEGSDERRWFLIALSSPLFIVHALADLHLDVLMGMTMLLSFLALRRRKIILAGLLLGMGIALKFTPAIMLPFLLVHVRGRDRRDLILATIGTLVLLYLPFVGDDLWGNTGRFIEHWSANAFFFTVGARLFDGALARMIMVGLMTAAYITVLIRWRSLPSVGINMALIGVLLFSPVVHAWYVLPAVLLLPLAPLRSVVVWATTLSLYAFTVMQYRATNEWSEPLWLLGVEIVPVLIAWTVDLARGPIRPGRGRSSGSGSPLAARP